MNGMVRFFAQFVSFVFHPLLMMTYMLILLLVISPYLFGESILRQSDVIVLTIFMTTAFIPGFAVLMMKWLELVESYDLQNRTDRTGPYILTGVFYTWIFRNFLDNPDMAFAFKVFALGATIGLFVAFFVNLFSKISLHAVGMGGLVTMVAITMLQFSYSSFGFNIGVVAIEVRMTTLFISTILLAGIVGTARLYLGAHRPVDLYGGYIVGITAQLIAFFAMITFA